MGGWLSGNTELRERQFESGYLNVNGIRTFWDSAALGVCGEVLFGTLSAHAEDIQDELYGRQPVVFTNEGLPQKVRFCIHLLAPQFTKKHQPE